MTDHTIDSNSGAAIIERFDARPEMLVQILVAVVSQHGWVSDAVIRQLADALNLSRADVHGVVDHVRGKPPRRSRLFPPPAKCP